MKTSKPVSGIGWCSKNYTKFVLDQLVKNGTLSFYAFVEHKPEVEGEKIHTHIYVVPNKHIEVERLRNCFSEPCEGGVNRSVSAVWNKSDFRNWYLYALHDKAYLDSKKLMRIFEYKKEDFIVSSWSDFLELSQVADSFDLKRAIYESASKCVPWVAFVQRNFQRLPLPQLGNIREMYLSLLETFLANPVDTQEVYSPVPQLENK